LSSTTIASVVPFVPETVQVFPFVGFPKTSSPTTELVVHVMSTQLL
jgi:hypothetical protein